jgi:hypothetical protein
MKRRMVPYSPELTDSQYRERRRRINAAADAIVKELRKRERKMSVLECMLAMQRVMDELLCALSGSDGTTPIRLWPDEDFEGVFVGKRLAKRKTQTPQANSGRG